MIVTKRLVIHGRVQGVGYRYSMTGAARRMSVTGWVRNRRDGTVEAIVQGVPSAIDQITDWARRGPAGASVTQVEVFEDAEPEIYASFTQQSTA